MSCPSLRRTWAVRSAPALTTSSAGAAAAGLAHFHGTFASASISALPGLLVCSAGPFRSTRSALRVGLRLPPGRSGGRIGPRLVSLSLALAALLARNRHGCGLAFHPLGCCPCHCAQSIPVKVRPGGFGCGDALRNLRSLRFRAWGCPRARGALAGVSALAGGRFRRRSGLIFISPALPPSRGLQPHHLPISIPTRRQEYTSSMAITVSFRWHFCRRQFPATHGWSHLPGESSKRNIRHPACG